MSAPTIIRQSFDPHGYVPVIVDDRCLSIEERNDAVIESLANPPDWKSHVDQHELTELNATLKKVGNNLSANGAFFFTGEPAVIRERRFELARLGSYRAYARKKYAGGFRIGYGDSLRS